MDRSVEDRRVRVRPFATICPESPGEYCTENADWAQLVYLWLVEVRLDVQNCCGEDIGETPMDQPGSACSDWQAAWAELETWANTIRPYLKKVEEHIEECTGDKIAPKLPTPKAGTLKGNTEQQLAKNACKRARKYFKDFDKWGEAIADAFNDHCESQHPTHLSDPPDPPF